MVEIAGQPPFQSGSITFPQGAVVIASFAQAENRSTAANFARRNHGTGRSGFLLANRSGYVLQEPARHKIGARTSEQFIEKDPEHIYVGAYGDGFAFHLLRTGIF